MRTEQRDPVVKALRRMKATKFLVTLQTGDVKTLSLSSKRNRWDDLSRLLENLDWRRIEGQDDKGVTLGVLAGEGDDDVESDLDDDDAGPLPDEVAKYVKIMQGCYHDAMTQTRAMFSDQLSGLGGMVETMVSAMRVQQESYAAAMKLQAATLTQPEGEGESDPTQKMLEIAAALYMQNPQMLMGLLKKSTPPAGKPPAPEVVQRAKTPAPDTRRNPAKPLQNGARARSADGDIITIPVDKTS